MRLPRDIAGAELVKRLAKFGYKATRQTGSHVRLTHAMTNQQNHLTVPMMRPIPVGTLASILRDVALQQGIDYDEVIRRLL